jgi:predicted small lipoprotein YifL
MNRRLLFRLGLISLFLLPLLTACGQKGPLYLPDEPAQKPATEQAQEQDQEEEESSQ